MVQGSILEAISVFILYEQEFILFFATFCFYMKHVWTIVDILIY
jgi:hypothetical protein